MGDKKVLRLRRNMDWYLDVEVDDIDMCNVLDIYIELLEGAAKKGFALPENPSMLYVYKSKSRKLEKDCDLLELFKLYHDKKELKVTIGSADKPCESLQLARTLLESKMSSNDTNLMSSHQNIPSTGFMDETQPTLAPPACQLPPPSRAISFNVPQMQLSDGTRNILQSNIRSLSLPSKRIPPTSARRKGIHVPVRNNFVNQTPPTSGSISRTRGVLTVIGDNLLGGVDDFDIDDDEYDPLDSLDENSASTDDGLVDEDDPPLPYVDDGYDPEKSSEWEVEKDAYFDQLYENGEFHTDNQFGLIKIRLWMIFFDKEHLSRVLRDFCIQEGVAVVTQKSDTKRLVVACVDASCGWSLHASRLSDGYTWAIKKLDGEHTCTRLNEFNPMATKYWAAEKIIEDVRLNPDIPGKTINELLKSRYGVMLRRTKTYKARSLCLEEIQGSHDTSYSNLPAYCEVLKCTNPGSKVHCAWKVIEELPEKPLQFKNIFVSLKPMIEGFKGCRGLIGVDGCHLKGKYGGVLLSAIALDGNKQIFPLAYGVYENESKSTWFQSFSQLKDALKDDERQNLTIISDRQKGIEPALDDSWLGVNRRLCCRHLCSNFKKKYPGRRMHALFWECCKAFSEFTFNKAIEMMQKEAGFGAVKWLHEAGEKEQWARHKFDHTLCCDENSSNFVESFNNTVGVDRNGPVLSLLEGIRRTHMVRYVLRQEETLKWPSNGITPKVAEKLKKNVLASRTLQVYKASNTECEVRDGHSYWPVNFTNRTCACGEWQISGIPCKHAVRGLLEVRRGEDLESYVSDWFSVQTYKMAYSVNFHPVPDEGQWTTSDFPSLNPPSMKRGVGRPPRNRRREEDEKRKGKRSVTVRCSKCKSFGHNARTCKGGLTAREIREQQGICVEQRHRKRSKRPLQPEEIAPDFMGSAPWNPPSQHD